MKIAVIDNYDSFTYNLVHYLKNQNADVDVFKNDAFDLHDLEIYDKILLSPGSGIPDDAGLLKSVIKTYYKQKSILGVCLGLQAIAEVFGGNLINLQKVYHGVASNIKQINPDYLYDKIPEIFEVGRYHSWVASYENLSPELIVTSIDENNQIMSLKHIKYDLRGIQFHPESILTTYGQKIIENWVKFDSRDLL